MEDAMVFATVFAIMCVFPSFIQSEDHQVCRWIGSAPFCGFNYCDGDDEYSVMYSKTGGGKKCWTGQKTKCCRDSTVDFSQACRWFGTSPFCNGQCPPGNYTEVQRDSWGDGEYCVTGSKANCCTNFSAYGLDDDRRWRKLWTLSWGSPPMVRLLVSTLIKHHFELRSEQGKFLTDFPTVPTCCVTFAQPCH